MALRKLGLLALLFSVGIGCSDATPRPAAGGAGGAGGNGGGGGTAGYGLDRRPANPGCVAPAAPPGPANVKVVSAFPALAFTLPLDLVQASGRPGRWYAVEKGGRVWVAVPAGKETPLAKGSPDAQRFDSARVTVAEARAAITVK
jgi:hypothetical protein